MTHEITEQHEAETGEGGSSSASIARSDRPAAVQWGAVIAFVAVSFGLAWLVVLPLWLVGVEDLGSQALGMQLMVQGLMLGMMFTPLIATLVVVFPMKAPRHHRARFLGLWPLRPATRVVWFIVGGLFAPVLLIGMSLAIAAAFGWLSLDLENFSGFEAALGGVPVGMSVQTLVLIQVLVIPVGAILNVIPAFGEEIGWRGWLLPALRPLGTWPALVLSGMAWGLWHTPVVLLGHNFGLFDWRGVLLMTVGCTFWGVLLGWSRLRSGSVWPAVIAHGAVNAAGGTFALVAAHGEPLSLPLLNPLGVAGWIAAAGGIAVLLLTKQFHRQPELSPSRSVPGE